MEEQNMAEESERIILNRDCAATVIPNGTPLTLPKGTGVQITQALGGTFTVITEQGFMASIAGKDADALGKEIPASVASPLSQEGGKSVEEMVWDQLRTCYDPEIPHNIVDLGLVYECKLTPAGEDGHRVNIKMTLTAPGCGMGDVLRQDVRNKILTVPGIKEANVEVVFDPPWNQGMMSKALRLDLNM